MLLFLGIVTMSAKAQFSFEKTYGGKGDQFGFGVALLPDGYVACGHTAAPGSLITDGWILSLDAHGDTLWTRKAGGSGIDHSRSVIVTPDSCLVVCGTGTSGIPPTTDFFLLKMTFSGDTLWTRRSFSPLNSYGYSIAQAQNGFILCGYADSGRTTPRMMLIRTDADGNPLWTRLYGDTASTAGFSAVGTPDGGFMACGYIDNFDPDWNRNIYLVRTNGNGEPLWTRTFSTPGYDLAWDIALNSDSGFILTGYREIFATGFNLYAMRITVSGDILWERDFGRSGLDIGYSGMQTADGGFIFCGQTNEQGNEYQGLYLVRTDAGGDSLWTRTIGEYPKNTGSCVLETPDGGFIIAGGTNSSSADGFYDVLIVKTDENGTITSSIYPQPRYGIGNLYPNPSSGSFTVYADAPILRIEIIDIKGNTITCTEPGTALPQHLTITLGPTCKGLFFVHVTTLHNQFVRKLILF